ncbi:NIPSNAP family protein [Nonomuraea typhae]|uniref:NIPSNAP family protein n=1 Tax=Nonomuraea typhae TaxID=2603600 RepID=UPI001C678952|nr:NIPSNAP family protein [Nonomuraea typhae]
MRTYRLKPGTRDAFVRAMREQAIPMLLAHGIEVVGCGPSLADEDGHEEAYLLRAFDSLEAHERQEAAFYSSPTWLEGPRQAIVSHIESYHSVAIDTSRAAVNALKH